MEVEGLRVVNTERRFEAEARGLESKAGALRKYNEAATFLELAKMHIEAERDVHIDQARAMGGALAQAQIRMYGGGADGTMDTIRGLFTSGFGLGEILEGVSQSMPEGLRDRLARNGIRGLFGRPNEPLAFRQGVERLEALAAAALGEDRSCRSRRRSRGSPRRRATTPPRARRSGCSPASISRATSMTCRSRRCGRSCRRPPTPWTRSGSRCATGDAVVRGYRTTG